MAQKKTLIGSIVTVVLLALLVGTQFVKPTVSPFSTPTPLVVFDPHAPCHVRGVLPDPNCTPGVIDPAVTQANIQQTICVPGYTKTVRPPVSLTNSLKAQQLVEYGYVDTNLHDYEEEHFIILELGGSPTDPNNLWPEPGSSPNPKNDLENLCHQKLSPVKL